jgi:hypothetical protein
MVRVKASQRARGVGRDVARVAPARRLVLTDVDCHGYWSGKIRGDVCTADGREPAPSLLLMLAPTPLGGELWWPN